MFRTVSVALVGIAVADATWFSTTENRFSNATVEDVKALLGTVVGDGAYRLPLKRDADLLSDLELPESFDAAKQWPECADVINHVRDQSSCGSCWAFGSTTAMNDRRCIVHGEHELLSAQHTTSCCSGLFCGLSQGCNGGQPGAAWKWFTRNGVVTGGDYGDTKTCVPYAYASCAHHVESDVLPSCDAICPDVGGGGECDTPSCPKTCTNDAYGTAFSEDLHMAKSAYSLRDEKAMMKDLVENGPVTIAMTVKEGFETYHSGVYQSGPRDKALGGHSMVVTGYGVENGTPYWLVRNSWSAEWGDKGFIKIIRGTNEGGIDSSGQAGEV